MPSLTRAEAAERAALLSVTSYAIDLDLTADADTFRSTTTIRFAATAGATTFVEVKPVKILSVRLNGAPLDAAVDDNRLTLPALADGNELVVEAEMAYSHTGDGLHRFTDPADGAVYLYALSFLEEGQRIFACFDQPDLKAPVTLTVAAPPGWLVAGNGELASAEDGVWRFAPTAPLATYFVSLLAGPYHVIRDSHDGVPLALYCRASLAGHLDADADEILTVTKQCLDEFHALFGVRYPFGAYEQAFVPEFAAGAMENPGLVTIRDEYVFRSAVTDTERELRATTIAHEMAHMWFGDLVTMAWWDDLWLNESFAEYLGTRVAAAATRFDRAWTTFGMNRKAWGYAADQRPSTHPVAPDEVNDTQLALLNFDGISYAKGAAVLRQLVAWLGDEAFLTGLRAHFAAHAFGNATLADLLGALSAASGRDLTGWARAWLRTAGVNTLRAAVTAEGGAYTAVSVLQEGATARPHRIGVGLYDRTATGVVLRRRVEVDLDPAATGGTPVPELAGEPVADLLLLNDGDLTFAKVRLDDASAAAVPAVLPALADPLARAVIWSSVLDTVRDGERPVAELVALVLAALPAETEVVVVEDVLSQTRGLTDRYLDPATRPAALALLAQACDRLLAAAPAGGSLQLAAARGLIGATVDARRLRGLLDGAGVPEGIAVDDELRWLILHRLVVLGAATAADVDAELARDRSASGEHRAALCRSALPDAAAKERAWAVLTGAVDASNRIVEANAEGFWQPEQAELTAPYVERYFAQMPEVAGRFNPWLAERVAKLAYPRLAVAARTRQLAADLLAAPDLPAQLRRAVVDADDDLRRALSARG
ncbi:aminopeptidase N [Spirilliplanes yamanashiensis]|uniref:Aminopeptidase N n=1 Tax=Spirilliplanes yamanashiensis TaxID=42233 RepID=A0A8J3YE11_9ACTN|nr:aminopeptidase N [Spirilliplanes yamanashiensis]MDP9816484.1 aminopeptidase N [Spirilliplanes yamanashiensis]GIJ06010.1 aminopeptidase [Spirilliplanes yamanashiensis]